MIFEGQNFNLKTCLRGQSNKDVIIIVSSRIFKKSVDRNLIKRRLRETIKKSRVKIGEKNQLRIYAKKSILNKSLTELIKDFDSFKGRII